MEETRKESTKSQDVREFFYDLQGQMLDVMNVFSVLSFVLDNDDFEDEILARCSAKALEAFVPVRKLFNDGYVKLCDLRDKINKDL